MESRIAFILWTALTMLLVFAPNTMADVIELSTGERIEGNIASKNKSTIHVEGYNGANQKIRLEHVKTITHGYSHLEMCFRTNAQIICDARFHSLKKEHILTAEGFGNLNLVRMELSGINSITLFDRSSSKQNYSLLPPGVPLTLVLVNNKTVRGAILRHRGNLLILTTPAGSTRINYKNIASASLSFDAAPAEDLFTAQANAETSSIVANLFDKVNPRLSFAFIALAGLLYDESLVRQANKNARNDPEVILARKQKYRRDIQHLHQRQLISFLALSAVTISMIDWEDSFSVLLTPTTGYQYGQSAELFPQQGSISFQFRVNF